MRPDLDRAPDASPANSLDPTRAKPQPWLVGNGTGLMIGVLTVCGVLILVRIATVIWFAEAAWSWWQSARPETVPLESATRIVPAPPRAVPPPDPRKSFSRPTGNPGLAFGPNAYPSEAMVKGQQGRVVASLSWTGAERRAAAT